MSKLLNGLLVGAAVLTLPAMACAEMTATTVTDMEVHAGPGPDYPTVGVATRGSPAMLDGCMQDSNWCRIDVNGVRGWVFAETLAIDQGGTPMIVQEHRNDLGVPVVTYETTGSVAAPADPQPGDELLGRVEDVNPPELVRTYIDANPLDTITVEQQVVIGSTLPDTVTMVEVPDYQYRYVRVNDRSVLVDPATRQIVYVYQ